MRPEALASAPGRQSAGFDLIIIGAGPAGVSAALTAAEQGLRVVVIDEHTTSAARYSDSPGRVPRPAKQRF